MEKWLIYGLIASLFYGASIIASKIATSEKYFGIDVAHVSLLMLIGIGIVFIGSVLLQGQLKIPQSPGGIISGIIAGALWALGMLITLKAIQSGADVAKLTPIYNTNTLVAVILGIVLLRELPQTTQMIKVLIGAILVVLGALLVAF